MRGFDRRRAFYIAIPMDNADGSFTAPCADGRESFKTASEAFEYAKDDMEQYGGESVVFVCMPLKELSLEDDQCT